MLHWQVVGHEAPEMRNVVSTNSHREVRWVGWIEAVTLHECCNCRDIQLGRRIKASSEVLDLQLRFNAKVVLLKRRCRLTPTPLPTWKILCSTLVKAHLSLTGPLLLLALTFHSVLEVVSLGGWADVAMAMG